MMLASWRAVAIAALILPMATGLAAAPARVRGTVSAIDPGSLAVQAHDGRIYVLKTGPQTAYAEVVRSSLDAIKAGDFVGAAVKGPDSAMTAVELVIIPKTMRAGRISLYGWDPLPDPTAGHRLTSTRMTNGLVSSVSAAGAPRVDTQMANGRVAAETRDRTGRRLTVTYESGRKSFHIAVPRSAPIVRYILADRSALTVGAPVMIKTGPDDTADLISIGKGVVPPM